MIVEGQIMGGLTEAYAMASMQFITFDAEGNCVGSNYMDYLLPTAWETPGFELHEVVTPCPHHPIGAKGVGECATVGGPASAAEGIHVSPGATDEHGCYAAIVVGVKGDKGQNFLMLSLVTSTVMRGSRRRLRARWRWGSVLTRRLSPSKY